MAISAKLTVQLINGKIQAFFRIFKFLHQENSKIYTADSDFKSVLDQETEKLFSCHKWSYFWDTLCKHVDTETYFINAVGKQISFRKQDLQYNMQ